MTQELKAVVAIAIAREAFIYGFPIVEGYKTLYKQAVDTSGSDDKAPINHIGHARDVATPEDTWVVAPNPTRPTHLRGWIFAPSLW